MEPAQTTVITHEVLTMICTVAGVFIANLAIVVPLFYWVRSEGNSDRRQMQDTAAADRRDFLTLIREIKDELKEFHGRLIQIEERARK